LWQDFSRCFAEQAREDRCETLSELVAKRLGR
jgi:hypothetical protein